MEKIRLERDIWVYQKWDGIIACPMAGGGGIQGLVDGQLGGETHQQKISF
jgi:hypothetical protein